MYNYIIHQKSYQLTQDELTKRLTHLTHTTKANHWIGRDLKVYSSSFIGRFLWIIVKHFACMRQIFYGVDLEESKSILQQLKPQLQQKTVQDLFNQAVLNFNTIAPRHQVGLLEEKQVNVQPEPKLVEPEPIQQELIHLIPTPDKKTAISAKVDITQKGYNVDAKIFDGALNKHIGHIEGAITYKNMPQPGYYFHINTIGMKEGGIDYIGKGYGTLAFRQYMDYLMTSDNPLLKQVKSYTLVTHRLAPQPVKLFKRAGFEEILEGHKDYECWMNTYSVSRDPKVVMMVKKREE